MNSRKQLWDALKARHPTPRQEMLRQSLDGRGCPEGIDIGVYTKAVEWSMEMGKCNACGICDPDPTRWCIIPLL